jgi:hypothetical protein
MFGHMCNTISFTFPKISRSLVKFILAPNLNNLNLPAIICRVKEEKRLEDFFHEVGKIEERVV